MSHVEVGVASTHFPLPNISLPPPLSTFHPEMELAQLCLQLTFQQTHALGGMGRDRRGSTTSPFSPTLPYPVPLPHGHPSLTSVYSRCPRVASARLSRASRLPGDPVL